MLRSEVKNMSETGLLPLYVRSPQAKFVELLADQKHSMIPAHEPLVTQSCALTRVEKITKDWKNIKKEGSSVHCM